MIVKRFKYNNFKCFIRLIKNTLLSFDASYYCGYVIVPDKLDTSDIKVHGRITYEESLEGFIKDFYSELCNSIVVEDAQNFKVIGFDCAHYGDDVEKCSEVFVTTELINICKQLKEKQYEISRCVY